MAWTAPVPPPGGARAGGAAGGGREDAWVVCKAHWEEGMFGDEQEGISVPCLQGPGSILPDPPRRRHKPFRGTGEGDPARLCALSALPVPGCPLTVLARAFDTGHVDVVASIAAVRPAWGLSFDEVGMRLPVADAAADGSGDAAGVCHAWALLEAVDLELPPQRVPSRNAPPSLCDAHRLQPAIHVDRAVGHAFYVVYSAGAFLVSVPALRDVGDAVAGAVSGHNSLLASTGTRMATIHARDSSEYKGEEESKRSRSSRRRRPRAVVTEVAADSASVMTGAHLVVDSGSRRFLMLIQVCGVAVGSSRGGGVATCAVA